VLPILALIFCPFAAGIGLGELCFRKKHGVLAMTGRIIVFFIGFALGLAADIFVVPIVFVFGIPIYMILQFAEKRNKVKKANARLK
jgi:predicted tellurium resistance membrane protein TerC